MPFQAPKGSAFKQFVLLDAEGIVAALSAIDGGQIDEILTRSAEEQGGEAGGQLNVGVAKGGGKRQRTRTVEEEIRRARTRHATAAKLLDTLKEKESIGVVDGRFDMDVAKQLTAGMVLEFRAELRLHPIHQADAMLRSFLKVAPKFGEKQISSEMRPVMAMWGALIGTDQADTRLLIEPYTTDPQEPRLLLPIRRAHFEVDVADLLSEVTVIAQVERLLTEGEHYPALRMLHGAPSTQFERSALEEGIPDLVDGLAGMGIPISEDDVFMPAPAVLLRAICAYR